MKTHVTKSDAGFAPIVLTLTFETEAEAEEFARITDYVTNNEEKFDENDGGRVAWQLYRYVRPALRDGVERQLGTVTISWGSV